MSDLRWEEVSYDGEGVSYSRTYRAEVPGGHLFRIEMREVGPEGQLAAAAALAFVPDPEALDSPAPDPKKARSRIRAKKKRRAAG